MIRRPAASRRAAAATTSITMKAGTSLRADAFTPTRPASASEKRVGWGTAKRLALSRMTALAPAEAACFRPRHRHHAAELQALPVAAAAPLPPHLPDWYCHRSASLVLTTRERVSSLPP